MSRWLIQLLLFIILVFTDISRLYASRILYTGSGDNLSASAIFELSGSNLTIVLTNASASDVLIPVNVLTGLFFNTSYALTPISASLNGSSVFYKVAADPGLGWGYGFGVDAQGMNNAISASGAVRGLGQSNFSETSRNLGGLDYGILSLGDDPSTGNKGVTGKGPLFKNSVAFAFLAPEGFALSDLGDSVFFQYGTSLSEIAIEGYDPPTPSTIPEPGTVVLLGSGLSVLALIKRREIRSFFRKSSGAWRRQSAIGMARRSRRKRSCRG